MLSLYLEALTTRGWYSTFPAISGYDLVYLDGWLAMCSSGVSEGLFILRRILVKEGWYGVVRS